MRKTDSADDIHDDVEESGHSLLEAMQKARSIGTLELQWFMTVEAEARELAKQLETEKARLPYLALASLERLCKLLKDGPE